MAEYWKSTPKYWCKHCQIYIRDTAFEKTQHEATGKHQGNLKRFLNNIHRNKEREERESQRTKNEVERLRNLVSGKPATPTATDATRGRPSAPPNAPRQATAEDRKKQMAQLAEMGIVVPEEYRKDMALAGAWETISERRLTPAEETKGDATLNIGVRKRKHENDEDEEEAAILAKSTHRGWGNATLSYPGAADEDDDLDALLSKTAAIKRTDGLKPKSEFVAQEAKDETGSKITVKAEADLDSATTVKKEEPDVTESPQISPAPGNHDPEGLPSVVFKKRRNKPAKH